MGTLYYGDNLYFLKDFDPQSVDLIYLDPPFNSKSGYNLLFRTPEGSAVQAQTAAFKDTWRWDTPAADALEYVLSTHIQAGKILTALRAYLGQADMMAYLAMMAARLVEMHRILKPAGSLYLHCDPTASHYLKVLLDGIFGPKQFRNEVIWDYTFRLMDLPRFFNRKHDVILFYAKGKSNKFKMPKTAWTRDDLIASRKQKIHVDDNGVEWIWMPGGRGNSKEQAPKGG